MKHLPTIAATLLGLMFIAFGLMVLLKLGPTPPAPPEGSPVAHFMTAFSTGYLTFVKVLEVVGGLLLIIPRTRNWGLLVLGPIILNIIAFHAFVMQGEGLTSPIIIIIAFLAAYLLYSGRKAFLGLLR